MKKYLICLLFICISTFTFAQQKFALVIGNSNYTGISPLVNPLNDANDMEVVLRDLGFTVHKVIDGNLQTMENAVTQLKQNLSRSAGSYGFFFYAGHGVQSNGENYLIPVNASIPSENALRERAVALNWIMAELNDAGNELNFIVLDSCRDNPFSWNRNLSRGLAVVSRAPPGSIIFYATSDGRPASDGVGRNGLFTTQLLTNLRIPGLEITDVIRNTGAAVRQSSGGTQIPAVYNQFFGIAYLGTIPDNVVQLAPQSPPSVQVVPAPTHRSANISFTGDSLSEREKLSVISGLKNALQTRDINLEINDNHVTNAAYGFNIEIILTQTTSSIIRAEVNVAFLQSGKVLHRSNSYTFSEFSNDMVARRIVENLRIDNAFFNRINESIR